MKKPQNFAPGLATARVLAAALMLWWGSLAVAQQTPGVGKITSTDGSVRITPASGTGSTVNLSATNTSGTNGGGLTYNFDPQYFTVTAKTNVTFVPINETVDTRPTGDYDIKAAAVSSNTPVVIFTNNGACTVIEMRVEAMLLSSIPGPIISFYTDGMSNGCQLYTLLAIQGEPTFPWGADTLDYTLLWHFAQFGGTRQLYINAFTNCGIVLSGFYTNVSLWTDVGYRVGTPAVSNRWFCQEVRSLSANGAAFSLVSQTNIAGQIESVEQFTASTNGFAYLEQKPFLYADGIPYYKNGNEDFFRGAGYWQTGQSVVYTAQRGTQATPYLANLYGWTTGNMSYLFPQNYYFNHSFNLQYTNASGFTITNDFLVTGWTNL